MRPLCLIASILTYLSAAGHALAEEPFFRDYGYEREAYGNHPLQVFRSTDLTVPRLNILKSSATCDDSLYTFLSPRGHATAEPLATIYDHGGHLVWASSWEGQQLYNFLAQEYKGEKYLTFWAGNDAVGGHGAGVYYMLDRHYRTYKKIQAANGLDGDLHDFRITEAGTALLVVYEVVDIDLSSVGKSKGPVWDCLIQEIDIETGRAIFQWRAAEHYDLRDSYRPIGGEGEGGAAYDFFHMNSIEKDGAGNYLISARYTHSLTYINGTNGDVIWIMGGKKNMFKDLSGGRATDFAYQHDARWEEEGTTITVFDNVVDNDHDNRGITRGLRLKVDQKAMTVTVMNEYVNPRQLRAISQGSYQTLPNGNVLLGYGHLGAFSEFASNGSLLCDVDFGPQSRFGTGELQSYRVYKFDWHGWPLTKPDTAVDLDELQEAKLFVSWNGATEVVKWDLQGATGANMPDQDWVQLDTVEKKTFESALPLRSTYPRFLRVVGRDANDKILGTSEPVEVAIEVLEESASNGGDTQADGSKSESISESKSQVVLVDHHPLASNMLSFWRLLEALVGIYGLFLLFRTCCGYWRRTRMSLLSSLPR